MKRFGKCKLCRGRGWTKQEKRDWADPCVGCGGGEAPTVRELAHLAGVSISSVYRFIQDHASVRDSTRTAIEGAVLT